MKGFNVIESPTVNKWMAAAEAQGAVKSKTDDLMAILDKKFGMSAEVNAKIESTTDLNVLQSWVVAAALAESLDKFRQAAGV